MRGFKQSAVLLLLIGLAGCQPAKVQEQTATPVNPRHETKPIAESKPTLPVTPQSIPKDMFPNAPEKTKNADCFRFFTPQMSIYMVVQKCGRPDEEVGSGVYIFIYHLSDGSTVGVNTPDLNRIDYLTITDASGKRSAILNQGRIVH